MNDEEAARTRGARAAAELALVRVVHHYGSKPGFVLLGGLVPELLCSSSGMLHAGTSDVDVQVDLEIAKGATSAAKLEQALLNAEFTPSEDRVWRWQMWIEDRKAEIKLELLADLDNEPQGAIVEFVDCESLGAVNLRGTGYASRDIVERTLRAKDGGVWREVQLDVSGLGGFLMAKCAAARGRNLPKDWYDIAFVLINNDEGGPRAASSAVLSKFGPPIGDARSWIMHLQANFEDENCPGVAAFVAQVGLDHPDEDGDALAADAVLAVRQFCSDLASED